MLFQKENKLMYTDEIEPMKKLNKLVTGKNKVQICKYYYVVNETEVTPKVLIRYLRITR